MRHRTTSAGALLACLLALAPAPAKAQPAAVTTPAGSRSEEQPAASTGAEESAGRGQGRLQPTAKWYGGETIAFDGVSVAVLSVGLALQSGPVSDDLLVVGAGGYAVAVPLVHVAHGKPWTALASFGIRLTAPVLFAAAFQTGSCRGDPCLDAGAAAGLITGAVVAIGLDAAVFAWERARPSAVDGGVSGAWPLTPLLAPKPGGLVVGVGGAL